MPSKVFAVKYSIEGEQALVAATGKAADSFDKLLDKAQRFAAESAKAAKQAFAANNVAAYNQALEQGERAAKAANKAIAASYRELGVSSSRSIEEAKDRAIAAYEAIRRSGVASARDIELAQTALNAKLKSLDAQLDGSGAVAGKAAGNFTVLKGALAGVVSTVSLGIFDRLIAGVGNLIGNIGRAGTEVENLKARLKVLEGSQAAASAAFQRITGFSGPTNFEVNEVTQAYISLKNRGIEPTIQTLTRLGDIANASGKPLQQVVEALLDATTGENERLKEFGIQAKKNGDQVTFTYRGVTQTVQATEQAIAKAILSFGDLPGILGATAEAGQTTQGRLSTINDSLNQIYSRLFEAIKPAIDAVLTTIGELLNPLGQNKEIFEEINKAALDFATFLKENPQIVKEIAQLLTEGILNAVRFIADGIRSWAEFYARNRNEIGLIAGISANILGTTKSILDQFSPWLLALKAIQKAYDAIFATVRAISLVSTIAQTGSFAPPPGSVPPANTTTPLPLNLPPGFDPSKVRVDSRFFGGQQPTVVSGGAPLSPPPVPKPVALPNSVGAYLPGTNGAAEAKRRAEEAKQRALARQPNLLRVPNIPIPGGRIGPNEAGVFRGLPPAPPVSTEGLSVAQQEAKKLYDQQIAAAKQQFEDRAAAINQEREQAKRASERTEQYRQQASLLALQLQSEKEQIGLKDADLDKAKAIATAQQSLLENTAEINRLQRERTESTTVAEVEQIDRLIALREQEKQLIQDKLRAELEGIAEVTRQRLQQQAQEQLALSQKFTARTEDYQVGALQSQADLLAGRGLEFEANVLRERAAILAENIRLQRELAEINREFATQPGMAAELERLARAQSQINLQAIESQFDTLGDSILGVAQDALGQLIEGLFTGQLNFRQLALSAVQAIGQIAAKILTSRLIQMLGGLFGGFGGGGGGLFSGAIFNPAVTLPSFGAFAEGGTIGEALLQESRLSGGRPVGLIAATAGEEILSLRTGEAQRYQYLKQVYGPRPLALMGNFALGGTIEAAALRSIAPPRVGGRFTNFTESGNGAPPVTIHNWNIQTPNALSFNRSRDDILIAQSEQERRARKRG